MHGTLFGASFSHNSIPLPSHSVFPLGNLEALKELVFLLTYHLNDVVMHPCKLELVHHAVNVA